MVTPFQPPRTCSGPDRRCASIKTSRVYPQVISLGIYSLTQREKTQNPGSNILNLGSRKFWKIFENTLLYIIVDFFGSGGGRGRFLYPPLVGWERDTIRSSFLPFGRLRCFVETVCTRKPWWSNPRHRLTPITCCFTSLSLPHPCHKQTDVVN